VEAAERLAGGVGEPVRLSDAMKSTQDELNSVREGALRSAIAAREAEQRKNDLVVYLAHDLKTPLTSVIGYLTLLRDEPLISPESRARYTGIALDKAERLETLVNEFFEITRFNLTHLTIQAESVNLTRLTEQVAFEFGPMLAEKGLVCETNLAPELFVVCDPDKIERVLDNLLKNAVSYSEPGTAIRLLLEAQNEKVTLRVENSGRTIPTEKLERIFEQFFRLDHARSSATGGAGLGLAIAREIVELHGGTIVAESADGRTAFTVTLPADRKKNV
jgi:two-component system sensor histidine kinase VanS